MAAGPLRHRVTIQTRQTSQNTAGQVIVTWVDGDTVWASVEPLRGQEAIGQAQIQAEVTHKVRMRGRSDVTVLSRIKFGLRIFEINEARDIAERGIWLELLCKEALA